MFAWSPLPEKFAHLSSLDFSKILLEEADIAVSPGLGFGEFGEGYVRLSLVENEQRIRQAARNLRKLMK
jgi:alanine-synthesizing transaminase